MARSFTPLRAQALALLLYEREKREARDIYLGNLQWSLLHNVYALGGGKDWALPSYGAFCASLDNGQAIEPPSAEDVRDEAAQGIACMLARHLAGDH